MDLSIAAYLLLFLAFGVGFLILPLLLGKLFRPERPHQEKETIYECGEPTIGSAWVQFDLRYYVVALLFVIFDVEVAFFFPWAVVFGQANQVARVREVPAESERAAYIESVKALAPASRAGETLDLTPATVEKNAEAAASLSRFALLDLVIFFGILLVGFAYLWKRGDLQWIRSTTAAPPPPPEAEEAPAPEPEPSAVYQEPVAAHG